MADDDLPEYFLAESDLPTKYCTQYERLKIDSITAFTSVIYWKPENRISLQKLHFKKCRTYSLHVGPIELHQCVVEDSRVAKDYAEFQGTCFSQCSFVGDCGKVWIEDASKLTLSLTSINRKILAANDEFYESVPWALDLSNAWFDELDLRGVPLDKIKCDPDRQLKFSYEKVDEFLRSDSGMADESGSALTMRVYHEHVGEQREDFLIASSKKKKPRQKFESLLRFAKENDLCVESRS